MRQLFTIDPYKTTILPELTDFFDTEERRELLPKFLRRFASTSFQCPSAKMIGQLEAEAGAAQTMMKDAESTGVEGVMKLAATSKIPIPRLAEIYRAVTGRPLPAGVSHFQDPSTPRLLVEAAVAIARKYPRTPKDQVAFLFGLRDDELKAFQETFQQNKAPKDPAPKAAPMAKPKLKPKKGKKR